MDTAARERKARKLLKNLDYKLRKTPANHWSLKFHPVGYEVSPVKYPLDLRITGQDGPYSMTIDDVEDYIAILAAKKVDEDLATVLRTYTEYGGDRFIEAVAAMVRRAA